jgi:hypothetical protein
MQLRRGMIIDRNSVVTYPTAKAFSQTFENELREERTNKNDP